MIPLILWLGVWIVFLFPPIIFIVPIIIGLFKILSKVFDNIIHNIIEHIDSPEYQKEKWIKNLKNGKRVNIGDSIIKCKNDILTINGISFSFLTIPTTILLFIMVILVSGITKYQMIAIASDSMFPSYQRGDAVIFEDVEVSTIKVGDILVFSNNEQVITHRVAKIKESENKLYFYTKGDANNSLDAEPVKQENVLGIIKNGIKYIGYPTVILNEIIKGR